MVWLTEQDVIDFASIATNPDDALGDAVAAVAAYVERVHPGYDTGDVDRGYVPPADIKLGAVMLAARLYERRGTLLGVAGFADFGGGPLLRQDPDIARLLRIGAHAPFSFGAPTPGASS